MATTNTPTKKAKAKRSKTPSTSKAKTPSNGSKASSSRPKAASSRSKTGSSRPKASSRPKRSSSRSKNGAPAAQRSSGDGSSSHGVVDELKSARDTVGDVGKKAASTTGKAVSKAKVPLIASGAALAGVAGGLALNSTRSKSSKVLGVKVPMKMPKTKVKIRSKDLVKAADRVAGAGEQIGRVSTGFRELQGTSDQNHGNGHHRSPLEVVIEGLTRRH